MTRKGGIGCYSPPPMLETKKLTVGPGPRKGTVRTEDGEVVAVPEGWVLLPPGDAGLTRKVKAGGACWTVKERVGRRVMSRGVWAPAGRIERARAAVAAQRATPEYARRKASDKARRDKNQAAYVQDFTRAVRDFLRFDARFADLELKMASAIAEHATPVGSGTVARTQRIPVSERAEAATIAWMRHQTTAYDRMHIPRIKGRRHEVRRKLAQHSRELLGRYRAGEDPSEDCPLAKALAAPPKPAVAAERPPANTPKPLKPPSSRAVRSRPKHAPVKKPPPAESADDVQDERAARQARIRARFRR